MSKFGARTTYVNKAQKAAMWRSEFSTDFPRV